MGLNRGFARLFDPQQELGAAILMSSEKMEEIE
jgi:hypothetical protein